MIDRFSKSEARPGSAGYSIVNDEGATIAWFDTLYECAIVKRYLSGVVMPRDDAEQAKEIIRRFDTKVLARYREKAV